jgi:positive regulator of sigma E activity
VIGIVLIVILTAAYIIGSLINDRNAARSIAIFAIGVVSFLGILGLSHRDTAGTAYDSGQVRVAVTTAFMMVYFAALGIFLFSTNTVGEFGRNLMENLTSLFGVVVGFYFAASAIEAYSRSREAAARAKAESAAATVPTPTDVASPSPVTSALEQEVSDLREMVAGLLAERERGGEPAPPQPPPSS